jgi:hypothetical protein
MTRTEATTALAKVLAFIACGRPEKARAHAEALVEYFRAEGVL